MLAKFLVGDEKTAGAAWLDPPPIYTETDPLKAPETDVEAPTPSSGASTTSEISDDSFWDDDSEPESSLEAGPKWSGGYSKCLLGGTQAEPQEKCCTLYLHH